MIRVEVLEVIDTELDEVGYTFLFFEGAVKKTVILDDGKVPIFATRDKAYISGLEHLVGVMNDIEKRLKWEEQNR